MVCSGREAIDRALGATFALVLTDIEMPDMDGLVATHPIGDARAGRPVPFTVVLTANAMSAGCESCLRVGMGDHLNKPIDVEMLAKSIVADRRRTGLPAALRAKGERRGGGDGCHRPEGPSPAVHRDRQGPPVLAALIADFDQEAPALLGWMRAAVSAHGQKVNGRDCGASRLRAKGSKPTAVRARLTPPWTRSPKSHRRWGGPDRPAALHARRGVPGAEAAKTGHVCPVPGAKLL
ncbi:response regulator [Salipiger mangrovisoli]|uniref:Response regulator n=1 Tax=Salipiger mangrovisoli TaxID=2865933 RepID=A0ABR9X8N7_9RHOB|nr:response regulator [Salipiger mangrovisoli]MBE9639860.1 response regulator [Salipiger mangrovisoli]